MNDTIRGASVQIQKQSRYTHNVMLALACAPRSVEREAALVASAFVSEFASDLSTLAKRISVSAREEV